ncbi:hypothetical protein [Actinocatenispora rupis]|uniref:PLD-like domain-containing protein n=1 Tax=Actinocatenispora rupis TaxID=519421 RepID=A0A8J3J1A0_9ACTN|nr:hypothetical protein [Actinocatenispora rupis]GID12383.1 hypothetical protein Aru02nite_32720 [Actinocatenispora rupis]
MREATVYVPCDAFSVRVQLGYGGLSPIEQLVLRALAAAPGAAGADDIVGLFGLGRQVTEGVIFDLLRAQHVVVDFGTGTVRLTEQTRRRVEAGTLDTLPGAELIEDRCEIMIDRLTGHVLPVRSGRPDVRLVVPVAGSAVRITDASQAQLLGAVTAVLERDLPDPERDRQRSGRPRRALSAYLAPSDLQLLASRRWLPLTVHLGWDTDADRLQVRVEDPVLPARHRELAAARLAQLADDRPEDEFVRRIRSLARGGVTAAPTFDEYLDQLRHRVDRLADTLPGTRRQTHTELRRIAERARVLLERRIETELTVTPVLGTGRHDEVLRELVGSAQRQVVIASPHLDRAGLGGALPSLRDAQQRGVQAAILWGRTHRDRLEAAAANVLTDLGGRHNAGRMLWYDRSCKINTSMVVCDDRRALIAGWDLLSGRGRDTEPLGLLLDAPGPGACAPIESMLDWLAVSFPDHRIATALYTRHTDFGTADRQPATSPLADLATMPETPREDEDDSFVFWQQDWQRYAARLDELAAGRTLPAVRVVADGEHRALLWSAIRGSARRLVVASPRPREAVVTHGLVNQLRARVAAGVAVRIATPARDEPATQTLRQLAGQLRTDRFKVPRRVPLARAVIGDDDVVLGGFDPLSDGPGIGGRGPRRSFLGVLIRGAAIADELAATLEGADAPPPPPPPPASGASADPGAGLGLVGRAHRLRTAYTDHAGRVPIAVLDAELTLPDPWPIVAELRAGGAPTALVRQAASRCLARCSTYDAPAVAGQVRDLIRDLWDDQDFLPAALLRPLVADPDWRPRPALSAVAATRHDEQLPDTFTDAALDGPLPAESRALACVGAAGLLLGIDGDQAVLREALELLDDLDAPWDELVRAALDHPVSAAPLPMSAIRARLADTRQHRRTDAGWAGLTAAIEHARQYRFDFDSGIRTHQHLFADDGPLGRLGRIAATRAATDLAAWLARQPSDVGTLLDRATRAAGPGTELLHSRRRARYLDRLRAVLTAARRVASAASAADSDPALDHRLLAARTTALRLSTHWPALTSAADALDAPEAPLARAALADLSVVVDWGMR